MKKSLPLLAVSTLMLLAVCAPTLRAFTIQYNLGSSGFTIDPGSTTVSYSQTETELILSGGFSPADSIAGFFVGGTYNFSGLSGLGSFPLKLSISGVNPDASFSVDLFDDTLNVINTYVGSTIGVSSTPSFVSAALAIPGTGDFASVTALQFTWNDSSSANMTFHQVVPEPSTYALVLMTGAGTILLWARRRK